MAYNRRNLLVKIIEAQDICLSQLAKGVKVKEIYAQHIARRFGISQRTFVRWMGVNAKKELKELNEQEATQEVKLE